MNDFEKRMNALMKIPGHGPRTDISRRREAEQTLQRQRNGEIDSQGRRT